MGSRSRPRPSSDYDSTPAEGLEPLILLSAHHSLSLSLSVPPLTTLPAVVLHSFLSSSRRGLSSFLFLLPFPFVECYRLLPAARKVSSFVYIRLCLFVCVCVCARSRDRLTRATTLTRRRKKVFPWAGGQGIRSTHLKVDAKLLSLVEPCLIHVYAYYS